MKTEGSKISGRDLRASSIGWELAVPIIGGPVVGYLIDKRYDSGVTFTLLLLGLGLFIGIYNLIRFIIYDYSIKEYNENVEKRDVERF
ncbi:MAG: AtpZ/AtpI family protein [Anaerolineaceae bacterium]|nr:AtpZ/AtpI family protein [Anaerolineaceae bacterium]